MGMKKPAVLFALAMFLTGFVGCNQNDAAKKDDHPKTPGEAAGHAAYVIEKETKKVAKEAAKDLKTFGHDAKEGFQKAKEKDLEKKPDRDPAK